MKTKFCPKCHKPISWDGLGWTCDICKHSIEPTPKEIQQAVTEIGNMIK